jgi:hypothetical protein
MSILDHEHDQPGEVRAAEEQQAEIREFYNDCLKRKEKDPKVDCSGYKTA